MPNSSEKTEGPKPEKAEKKKKTPAGSPKRTKVNPKLAIVQDVIQLMNEAQISELSFEQGGVKIHLRRGPGPSFENAMPTMAVPMAMAPAPVIAPAATAAAPAPAAEPAKADNKSTLVAPMVGTFYRSPSPDAKAFVEEGGKIEAGQVYCIIEAMKLMNEVKSEISGRIVKILVQNGQAVEFNQPLIIVDPS